MRVDLLPAAIADVRDIAFHLETLNPAAADQFLDSLDAVIERLRQFPRHGRRFEPGNWKLRKVLLGQHCVIYRLDQHVEVVRVIHTSRNITAIFAQDDNQP